MVLNFPSVKNNISCFWLFIKSFKSDVCFHCSKCNQALRLIVGFITNMMYRFSLKKIATYNFFYYKPMFQNISLARSKGMLWRICIGISSQIFKSSSLPFCCKWARGIFRCPSISAFYFMVMLKYMRQRIFLKVNTPTFFTTKFSFPYTAFGYRKFHTTRIAIDNLRCFFTLMITCLTTIFPFSNDQFCTINIKNFSTMSTNCFFHGSPQIKKPFSAGLVRTVKFFCVLRARFAQIENPFSLSNLSIPQLNWNTI